MEQALGIGIIGHVSHGLTSIKERIVVVDSIKNDFNQEQLIISNINKKLFDFPDHLLSPINRRERRKQQRQLNKIKWKNKF